MPVPTWVMPAIGAASSIFGNILNASSVNKANRESREYNERMYSLQRQDALKDWAMMNEYNSPAQQMQRLRDANLNPNLVYGNGAVANNASVPRSVNAESWRPTPTHTDLSGVGSSLANIYDIRLREAQTNNVEAMTSVAQQEAALKAANIASVVQGTAKSEYELQMAKDMRLTVLEQAAANLRKTQVDTEISLDQNERAAIQSTASLMEGAERILTMRQGRAKTEDERAHIAQQIRNLKSDNQLKQLDINLKKLGVQPGDNILARVLGQLLANDRVRPITKDDFKAGSIPDSTLRALGLEGVIRGGDPYRKK